MGFSLSNLLCNETDTFINQEEDYIFSQMNEDDYEYMQLLYTREKPLLSLVTIEEWILCARLDSIAWILKIRAVFEFQLQTAYLSVAYLDQFLSRGKMNSENRWTIRLLSVACLCVATKMEGCTLPSLPEVLSLEEGEVYMFESNVVQKMELLVLSTLEWNMRLVTPFDYIDSFVVKFCGDRLTTRNIVPKTIQILMDSLRDVNLMKYRPSVIAGAATLVALDSKLTLPDLELKINAHVPFPTGFLKMVEMVSCYDRMKELPNTEHEMLSEHIVAPNLLMGCLGGKKYSEKYVISGLNNKRKKMLVFKDSAQNNSIRDEKRPI